MGAPVSLRVGRSAGLTRHRRIIQHRGPIKGECLGVRRDDGRGTPHPSASLTPVSLRVGRFAGLTGHRRVIQYRDPLKRKAWGCATRGEGLGDKKKRPGALLLALFIAFWWCRSGRSGTGATGRRRGLRRGRRSWGPRWAAPRAGRSSSRRFGVFPPTWPADAGDASPAY